MQSRTFATSRQETLGARLERARLVARERRLQHVVARLQDRLRFMERANLKRTGTARAAAEFSRELEVVRRRLRLLGSEPPQRA